MSFWGASLMAQQVKNMPAMEETQEMLVWSLGQEDPLEEDMAIHSSIFAEKSHGQRHLAGYSPYGHKESETTERLNNNIIWQQLFIIWQQLSYIHIRHIHKVLCLQFQVTHGTLKCIHALCPSGSNLEV